MSAIFGTPSIPPALPPPPPAPAPVGENPEVEAVRRRARIALGGRMAEAELVGPKQPGLGGARAEAAAELAGLEADRDFRAALLDRSHPEHRAALARRSALARRAWDAEEGPAFGAS